MTGGEHGEAGLTRLALSAGVRDLVDDALPLLLTLDDHAGSPAQHLAGAFRVRVRAGKVVQAAVLHARAQGLGWAEIASYAGMKTSSVAERWQPVEQHWHDTVQRARGAGRPGPGDPHVVFAPAVYVDDLDSWASQHLDVLRVERWVAEGKDSSHPVSGGLPPAFEEREPR